MARMSTSEFLNHQGPTGGGGGFFKLREVGKSTGVIHPAGIELRRKHGMFIFSDGDDKSKDQRVNFNCTETGVGCGLCILKDWAIRELKDHPDMKDAIIMSGGKGKSAIEFTLDELAGNGYWDTKMTNVREGLTVGWVPTEDIDDEKPVYILDTNTGLMLAIKAVIQNAIDDEGQDGDPMLNPYPIVIKYDGETKNINDKYTAYRATGRKADIDEEVQAILDTPLVDESGKGINLASICKAPKPEDVMNAIEKAWTGEIEFSEFETYYERRKDAGKGGRKARGGRKPKTEDSGSEDGGGDVRQGGAASDASHCSNCGTKMGKSVKFCPTCGTAREEPTEDDVPFDDPPKSGGRKPRESKDDEPNRAETHCPDCDEKVVPNRRGRCPECAKELDVL
jgi:hypothetical protein